MDAEFAMSIDGLNDHQTLRTIFINVRGCDPYRGLRLNTHGLSLMCKMFAHYVVSLPENEVLSPRHYVYLDALSAMPYYSDNVKLTLFDHDLAAMLGLVGGSIMRLMEMERS